MAVSDSYWYDSSADEYVVPVIYLGDLTEYGDGSTNPHGPNAGMSTSNSASLSFKSVENPTSYPAELNPMREIKYALGRMGTFYPSVDTISGSHYLRLTKIDPDEDWIDYYAGGTDAAQINCRTTWCPVDHVRVALATATISNETYLGLYFQGHDLGPSANDTWNAWFFVYCEDPDGAYNELFELLDLGPAPGQPGYRPTGNKYVGDKAIGGRGAHSSDHGKQPGYYTDTLTNPGAPDESGASAVNSGMLTAYNITDNALANFATCLYSSTFSTALTGLFYNPLDFVISLNIFPAKPTTGSSTPVKLGRWKCTAGDLGTDASGLPLTNQFKTYNFGKIEVPENWGSFLDYSHTQIELFLPFIGSVEIDTAEVMNGEIEVEYTIDFFTGMCVANVNCNKTVVLPDGGHRPQYSQHSYQGNCAINVPLSQVQYGNMIGSLINAGTAGLTKGMGSGIATLASEAASGAFKPSVTTRGTISANAGFCSVLRPYLRITRPISAESDSFQEVMGYTSYVDSKLGECQGYCVCDNIDLSSITGATESELERIKQMCLEGVHV